MKEEINRLNLKINQLEKAKKFQTQNNSMSQKIENEEDAHDENENNAVLSKPYHHGQVPEDSIEVTDDNELISTKKSM